MSSMVCRCRRPLIKMGHTHTKVFWVNNINKRDSAMQKQQTRIQMGNVYKANTKPNVIFILDIWKETLLDFLWTMYLFCTFFSKWDKTLYSRHTIIQMKNCDFVVNFCYLGCNCVCVCVWVCSNNYCEWQISFQSNSVRFFVMLFEWWETFTWNVVVAWWRAMMKGLKLTELTLDVLKIGANVHYLNDHPLGWNSTTLKWKQW